MEAVASGMAVASLTIQLVDSIQRIKLFLRNVQDAPKELERLVDLLERLEALLEDVRDIVERQTSLQAQHFPLPSNSVFRCLRSCEKTLLPIHKLVQRHNTVVAQGASSFARLKRGMKLALKTKDVTELETRVEREIGYLHVALSTNTTSILIDTIATSIHNQESITRKGPLTLDSAPTVSMSAHLPTDSPLVSSFGIRSSRCVREFQHVPLIFRKVGLKRCKIRKYYRTGPTDTLQDSLPQPAELLFEKDDFTVVWTGLGYRITWSQSQMWEQVLPSLRVLPIVREFDEEVSNTISRSDVQGLQQLFASGKIHPFTCNQQGASLLHVAAQMHKAEICQLLLQYGVRPDCDSLGVTVFEVSVRHLTFCDGPNRTETLRTLLSNSDVLESIDQVSEMQDHARSCPSWSPEPFEWLWRQLSIMDAEEEFDRLRGEIFYLALLGFAGCLHHGWEHRAPKFDMTPRMRHCIQGVCYTLISNLFVTCDYPFLGFIMGSAIVQVLLAHGLDVEACRATTMSNINRYSHSADDAYPGTRKLIFEKNEETGWMLGFVWSFDPRAPAYLLINEFSSLSSIWVGGAWPLHPAYRSRLERRMASKERKQRARTGLKRPRGRMPGAWV